MMRFDCEAVSENIELWAAGALDQDDAAALEAHAESCPTCGPLLDQAREAAGMLSLAAPMVPASAALKSRVMASAAVLTDIQRPRRSARWMPMVAAAAIFVAVAAIGWGSWSQYRMQDISSDKDEVSAGATVQAQELAVLRTQFDSATKSASSLEQEVAEQDAVLNVMFEPDVSRTELEGTVVAPAAVGRCLWSRSQALGAFVAENLGPPSPGHTYQMWIVYEKQWVPAGSFDVDEDGKGRLIIKKAWDQDDEAGGFVGFAVTSEPAKDANIPSGELVLASARPQP
jgi:hypothetical protein